ncbi:transposase [Streptomyces sp. NRRL F-2664]|uniref:transposase n=1 Tax=Streptomyces sp. NRRL F-2664 TaxID=1463842 RepID=UPI002D21B16B|nr:transposase [Streptomyces sp. NRRL F-2664]
MPSVWAWGGHTGQGPKPQAGRPGAAHPCSAGSTRAPPAALVAVEQPAPDSRARARLRETVPQMNPRGDRPAGEQPVPGTGPAVPRDGALGSSQPRAGRLPRPPEEERAWRAGAGPITAVQVGAGWPHPGRFCSAAALASSPLPAFPGLADRHRTSRSGGRQLNRTLHTAPLIRMRLDPAAKAYAAAEWARNKTSRDARCLKGAVPPAVQVLERTDRP